MSEFAYPTNEWACAFSEGAQRAGNWIVSKVIGGTEASSGVQTDTAVLDSPAALEGLTAHEDMQEKSEGKVEPIDAEDPEAVKKRDHVEDEPMRLRGNERQKNQVVGPQHTSNGRTTSKWPNTGA